MGRYIGPKTKIARKFGEPIFGADKSFEKKNYPPGQHGIARKRKKVSEYGTQLSEKQKAKAIYGVQEKQFRRTFEEAARVGGITGENLLKLLECRLDNVVFRLGLREKSKSLEVIQDSLSGSNHSRYSWLEWEGSRMSGKFLQRPERADIPENINEQLIVELYSK